MSALVKISDDIITSSGTHTVTLTGINSTYSTYMVKVNNCQPSTDDKNISMRVTKSGAAQDGTDYSYVHENVALPNGNFGHTNIVGSTAFVIFDSAGNGAGETNNAIIYLYNFPEASEYSHFSYQTAHSQHTPAMRGYNGGGVHEVSSASDGVSFFTESSVDFANGAEFALYGLKK